MKKIKKAIILVTIVVVIIAVLATIIALNKEKIALALLPKEKAGLIESVLNDVFEPAEPEISVEYISKKLEKISSLQTAQITYGCVVDFEEGKVDILSKKSFSMYYEVTTSAGIDVSEIVCTEENGKYTLTLPAAKLGEPNINPDSLRFYDVDKAIFNKMEYSDVAKAQQEAKKDVYYQKSTYDLLDMANKNAVDVLSNLLLCFLSEDKFEIIPTKQENQVMINPPLTIEEISKMSYQEVESKFKDAGFTNITLEAIEDVKIGVFTKDGKVESVIIDEKSTFTKSTIFDPDANVVIKYHTKKTK